jgi:hypothetical protein
MYVHNLPGTEKVFFEPAGASHPVATSGTAVPAFKLVKTAGHIVNGQALYTVNVRVDETIVNRERDAMIFVSMVGL